MENKLVSESLHEYRSNLNERFDEDELNEGLFGLNDQQKAKIKEIGAKEKLEDADVDALSTEKLVKPVLDAFKVAVPGTKTADASLKAKALILADPKKYKETLLKFIKVFVQGLTDTSKAKFYSLDPNTKMLVPRLNAVQKAAVGSELGQ